MVTWPRYDPVGRVGVLSEHTAFERLTGLDRLQLSDSGVLRVVGRSRRVVPVAIDGHRRRWRLDRRGFRVVVVDVVVPVLVRHLVDVFRWSVTAYRVHVIRDALPRYGTPADGPADFLTRPLR